MRIVLFAISYTFSIRGIYLTIRLLLSKSDPSSVRFTVRNHEEIYRRSRWGPRKRIERNGTGARLQHSTWPTIWAIHVDPTEFSVYQRAHATCSRPCAPLPSFRAFSMPPLSSRRRSRRRAHRNPSGKVGGKNSFLVIARGIPRVDHARRSV